MKKCIENGKKINLTAGNYLNKWFVWGFICDSHKNSMK